MLSRSSRVLGPNAALASLGATPSLLGMAPAFWTTLRLEVWFCERPAAFKELCVVPCALHNSPCCAIPRFFLCVLCLACLGGQKRLLPCRVQKRESRDSALDALGAVRTAAWLDLRSSNHLFCLQLLLMRRIRALMRRVL